jgi:metal-responsive CopG/Arc/MetJ family transcriptional regulator
MAAKQTSTARVYDSSLDELHRLKGRNETIADVIQRVLDERAAGEQNTDREQGRMEAGAP